MLNKIVIRLLIFALIVNVSIYGTKVSFVQPSAGKNYAVYTEDQDGTVTIAITDFDGDASDPDNLKI